MSALRSAIRHLGVDVVRYPHALGRIGHLRRLLATTGVSAVLDVGANEGQFAMEVRTLARFKGEIHSFEPHPASFERLQQKASRDPMWATHRVAIGDESRDYARLYTFSGSDWNSLHQLDDSRLARTGRVLTIGPTVDVQVRRLDGIWDQLGLGRHNGRVFLKSDTQGHDLAVLAGLGHRADAVTGLLIEASTQPIYEDEPTLVEILRTAQELGFTPSGFFPVLRRRDSLAVSTFDVAFVRDER